MYLDRLIFCYGLFVVVSSALEPSKDSQDTTPCNNGKGVFENMMFGLTTRLDRIERAILHPPLRMMADDDPSDNEKSDDDLLGEHACYEGGYREEGHVVKVKGREVYCDPTYGGWLVFLRREDGSVNFTRSWSEYKEGFGDIHGEHWLGNEIIHRITSSWHYKLRVDLVDWDNQTKFAEYRFFRVNEENLYQYQLIAEEYVLTSNGGNSLAYHNRMMFSTYDVDNDQNRDLNCAKRDYGGFWYRSCSEANPTGRYTKDPNYTDWPGLRWYFAYLDDRSFQKIEMKIRPIY